MDAIENLFAQYTIESLIITMLMILIAFKFISTLFEWFYSKGREYFGSKTKEEKEKEALKTSVDSLHPKLDLLQISINELDEKVENLEFEQAITNERLQEDTRSYIIDSYHRAARVGKIDEITRESMERQYVYYKNSGGDSFMDSIMERVRLMPSLDDQERTKDAN